MPRRNPCRPYLPSCIHILRWSLERGVKQRTWTGSAFSTNKSAWGSVMVTGSQSHVWNCPLSCPKTLPTHWAVGGELTRSFPCLLGGGFISVAFNLSFVEVSWASTRALNWWARVGGWVAGALPTCTACSGVNCRGRDGLRHNKMPSYGVY